MSAGAERLDELARTRGAGWSLYHVPGMTTPGLRYEVRVFGPERLRLRVTDNNLAGVLVAACDALEAQG